MTDRFSSGFYEALRSGSQGDRSTQQAGPPSHAGDYGPTLSFDKSHSMHKAQRKADDLAEKERREARRYALQSEFAKRNGGVNLCDSEEVAARDAWVSRQMNGGA